MLVALRTNCLYGVIKLKDAQVNIKALNNKKEDIHSYIKKYITNEERVAIYNYLLNQKE